MWFKGEWEGFVYPDKNNPLRHVNIGIFDTFEECRSAAVTKLSLVNSVSAGDYECGLNCNSPLGADSPKICERTER